MKDAEEAGRGRCVSEAANLIWRVTWSRVSDSGKQRHFLSFKVVFLVNEIYVWSP